MAKGDDASAKINITKRTLDAMETPAKDMVLWDRDLKCFGVRLTPSGTISFLVQYRNAQGRSRRITIGTYGAYTPAKAREEAGACWLRPRRPATDGPMPRTRQSVGKRNGALSPSTTWLTSTWRRRNRG
jgi:hypothetical protein